ncbi:hypothetical protein Poli38472_001527 [Pythium oligandrum]|uniref:Uncharacterized protein n=1 Tax=Pythium oligandrum TaxID=41045 RepID=A0A8K1CVH2_PYTOL|nr:hypothetical protein Poli38472_001527 [Pythium oligandrum]|eukprot:TMW69371.1 hypothetical protein Poli38472_001527 [Pythium oligandrum]
MVRVSTNKFLSEVSALYDAPVAAGRKGTVAISCKSVPGAKVFKESEFDHVLLFRAAKYGNNHHKSKFSAIVTPREHARFHSQLSHIIRTKADSKTRGGVAMIGQRGKGKKANE